METPEYPPEYDDAIFALGNPPFYSCSVQANGNVLLKHELDTPGLKSRARRWQMVIANLRGTVLTLRSDLSNLHLTVQAGEVGIAADYQRRSNCLRVRMEGRQFLLALRSTKTCLDWYRRLDEAIAISLPLESRKEPPFRAGLRKRSYQAPPSLRSEIICSWRQRRNSECGKWLTRNEACTRASETFSCHEMSISLLNDNNQDRNDDSNDSNTIKTAENGSDELTFDCVKPDVRGTLLNVNAVDYAPRSARELLYGSLWRYSWYCRDGQRYNVKDKADPKTL